MRDGKRPCHNAGLAPGTRLGSQVIGPGHLADNLAHQSLPGLSHTFDPVPGKLMLHAGQETTRRGLFRIASASFMT